MHRCSPRILGRGAKPHAPRSSPERWSSTLSDFAQRKIAKHSPSEALCPPGSFPKGFLASSLHCGIKKSSAANPAPPDLAVVVSDRPASAAGCFTRNVFKAAPVQQCTEALLKGGGVARGVVVNAGCANAVTGSQGLADARAMASALSGFLSRSTVTPPAAPTDALVMSTGVIGQLLPIRNILPAIPTASRLLSSSYAAWLGVAQAICTTDTFPKLRTRSYRLPGSDAEYRFVGVDKGAGMIHPNMAAPAALHGTLLGLICTDAGIEPASLQRALSHAVDRSFNSISVDGDTSTNDTILAMSNAAADPLLPRAAGLPLSSWLSESSDPKAYVAFVDALTSFAQELAALIVRDGEGATKLLRIRVSEAPSYAFAHRVAEAIARSSLVKCAVHGEDANWGRILCAVGYSPLTSASGMLDPDVPDARIDPSRVSVSFSPTNPGDSKGELRLLVNGEPERVDESRAAELLKEEEVNVDVRLGLGNEEAAYWTCDYSKEYIAINADYRS